MLKLTEQLKKWLEENAGVKAGSDDATYKAAAAGAMFLDTGAKGYLSNAVLLQLTADPEGQKAGELESKLDKLIALGEKNATDIATLKGSAGGAATGSGSGAAPPGDKSGAAGGATGSSPPPTGEKKPSYFEKVFANSDGEGSLSGDGLVRVKGAHERYSTTKSALLFPTHTHRGVPHPYAGQRAFEGDGGKRRYLDQPSELDQAVSGVWGKFALASSLNGRGPAKMQLNDHDKDLIQYALRNYAFGGVLRGDCSSVDGAIAIKGEKLADFQIKALLDDAISGGLEIAPVVFDDQIIMTPILNGEFFPKVNVVPITRGRRIESASMGNVTINSGAADNDEIPLFNTAAFIAAFDTTIFACDGGIEIGLDFLSDSPIDVNGAVTSQYGQVLLNWLDEQVCIGDGAQEPEGIMNASGTTSVSFGSTTPTVGKYLELLFGVSKKYKSGTPNERIMFGANEENYMRARQIAVGASDQRLVFGQNVEDYRLLGHPYGIGEFFSNSDGFFANMARYRMYRRMGLTLRATTEGQTLVRKNLMMITARARYGGQLEDGAAAAVTETFAP